MFGCFLFVIGLELAMQPLVTHLKLMDIGVTFLYTVFVYSIVGG